MDSATLFRVILFWHVLSLVYSVVPLAKKTKLCGNEACSEKLFDGKFHRSMGANDERFLAPKVDDSVSIYAIKFSDRTDLMEGALTREPERRGSFFSSYITLDGYVDFLRSAVESNKTLFMISTDPHDHPAKKLVGLKSAYPELIRDYEVNSQRLVDEGIIPQAVPLNLTALDPKVVEALSHDHSHSGHGHSHGGIGYEDVHSHNPPPVAIQPPPTKGPVAELSSDPASASLPSQQSPPVQQQPSLTQQQPPPVQQQPLPVQQQPLGVQQQPPPVQQQPSPVQQQSPPVQQQSPPVQQQPPPVQQQPSPVQQQSPSVQQQPPPTQQQPPPVQQQSSPVQQQSPPLQQQPSSVQQHPPPTQQQPPPVQQQPPPVQQQPLPVQQQPPLVQQQSPPSKQQPSPHHQQSSPVQEQSPTQHQSSPTVERPSSYSQQSNSAETLAGGRPPVAAANSATISSSEHVNEHGFAEQNVLIDEENVFDRFTHEGMKKEVAAGVDVTPPGNNDAVQQTVPGSTQQRIPRDAESVADSVKSQPNLNASQLRQHQNVLVLNAGGGIEQHSPQLQIVRTVAVPVSGVPANTQQPASSVTSHQAVVRPASVPISEIPIVDPSVVIHRAFVEQKNTGASSTRKVQDEGLLGSSQHPIGVGAGVPVGSGVNMNGETTNPIVDGANTVSVHSSDPPPILNVADMQNRYFVADNQLPVEIGVKEPSGSSITVNVADSDTIPDDTNTVPVASSNPSASFNAKSLQNGEPAADEQLPFEGGAQISFGSGMTVDAAAINSSVSKTTVIPAAPTINPPTHTSGGLSEPQTVPPGDQFRADNVISRGGGGNALLGSKFAEALPAQSLGRSQGQMFAGSPPLGSQQFPTNTESNENTRVRQFSAQQSVITQEPQPASDGDFSAHATNVPLEQFSSTQSPIVPSFSSIPVNDVHAGTVPVESPPAKFISVTTDFSEQQSGVNLDTQTPLSIPVKSADGRTLNEALVEAQIPPTLQAHSLLAARASGGIPHEPLISNVDIPTTTEPPFTLPVDVASAHGSAPSTAVTPPKPLPPTAEQFPSTISASDGISDGLDDRV
uniref:Uncharacterized protein n=1 Tax=Parascaris univalens TaxID=6257 RepID=A0A914ZDB0_PARUN